MWSLVWCGDVCQVCRCRPPHGPVHRLLYSPQPLRPALLVLHSVPHVPIPYRRDDPLLADKRFLWDVPPPPPDVNLDTEMDR